MNVQQKIAQAKQQLSRDTKGKFAKQRDPFLLWGEYPHGWTMIKDMILCFLLLNILIGQVKQIDISQIFTPRTLVIVNEAQAEVKEVQVVAEEVKEPHRAEFGQIGDIVYKVHRLESSAGKNDSCKNNGKFNGYGYAQNTFTWNCFETQEEVTELVTKWFEKNLKDKTLSESLCYYNTGIVSEDCPYYQRYLEL